MSFADPLVLTALLAIPFLIWWYAGEQRRRARAASAFVVPVLTASVAPRRPGWRRHAPMLAFALALVVLIVAAARPQRTVAKPVTDGAIMLANDVSSSMQASDVAPTRERAAQRAARRFLASVPGTVEVGLLAFARRPIVLQSPTPDHGLTAASVGRLPPTSGGTAIGEAIATAEQQLLAVPPIAGRRPPGAIVLISDGASNVGLGPLVAAREARARHIPIYTISVGTPNGTIPINRRSGTVTAHVPVGREQLSEIARVSGGKTFETSDTAGVSAAYARLAARLGHKQVKQEITASVAGGALVLLLLGCALSLRWFGRLV